MQAARAETNRLPGAVTDRPQQPAAEGVVDATLPLLRETALDQLIARKALRREVPGQRIARRYRVHVVDHPVLLVVHHTSSPALQILLEAVIDGTKAEGLEQVEVIVRPALAASAIDVLAADGFVLGTPANIGYMSGALKHFFDSVYYPCLTAKLGAPYGLYVHGNNDTAGAIRGAGSRGKRSAAARKERGTRAFCLPPFPQRTRKEWGIPHLYVS